MTQYIFGAKVARTAHQNFVDKRSIVCCQTISPALAVR